MTDKRSEIQEILDNKFGYTDVDRKYGDWRALRLEECADAILSWHEKQIEPLRKVIKKYKYPDEQRMAELSKASQSMWQAIKEVCGES
jgi:tRNA(Met) C34 N-acetyltransferase TmcA